MTGITLFIYPFISWIITCCPSIAMNVLIYLLLHFPSSSFFPSKVLYEGILTFMICALCVWANILTHHGCMQKLHQNPSAARLLSLVPDYFHLHLLGLPLQRKATHRAWKLLETSCESSLPIPLLLVPLSVKKLHLPASFDLKRHHCGDGFELES